MHNTLLVLIYTQIHKQHKNCINIFFINVLNPVCVSYDGVGHEKMHENQIARLRKIVH